MESKSFVNGLRQVLVLALTIVLAVPPGTAQQGGIIKNGSNSSDPPGVIPNNGFLFEPEFPLNSLKTVPIWPELEQLLDNPYLVATCASLFPGTLIGTTPGTTQIIGSPIAPIYPAYCTTAGLQRRPGFGVTLPPLMVHPLNYNPTDGEEMRLLNPSYSGGRWVVPKELLQCGSDEADADPNVRLLCLLRLNNPNVWLWSYERVNVSPGVGRVEESEIDYNAPIQPDVNSPVFRIAAASNTAAGLLAATALSDTVCIASTEAYPAPEGATTCGADPGEPGYFGFGVSTALIRSQQYSTPAVITGTGLLGLTPGNPSTPLPSSARLFDSAGRGTIQARVGASGGLMKPSLRIAANGGSPTAPNYLKNTNPNNTTPSSENDYISNRGVAAALGKALFWDMQVGSDAVQSCGSCHAHAGADNRVKNQMNPNHLGNDLEFEVEPPNGTLVASDFPFQKLNNPEVAADPKCTVPLVASIAAGVLENNLPNGGSAVVCDASNVMPHKNNANGTKTANDVASSMGVHWGIFKDIPDIGSFGPASAIGDVKSVLPDVRETAADCNTIADPTAKAKCLVDISDPIPGFAGATGTGEAGVLNEIRRVEPRNTPTVFAAALNFDNFWDGRANHDFNGGSVFGASDPQMHVWVNNGTLTPTRQIIRFSSLASLATGPGLSEFEMSFFGRNWAKIGKKLLQAGVTPLANQLVDPTDSILGPYSNQPGNPSPSPLCSSARVTGKPGLCLSYNTLISNAFFSTLHNNNSQHLNGCYTDRRPEIHTQCLGGAAVPILKSTGEFDPANTADPFDGYKLTAAGGAASATNTNEFTQMEGNFALFWGLAINAWATLLLPDNTPFDQFMDRNPDAFEAIGEVGETGLVGPLPVCTTATQRHCFREFGNFKRDAQGIAPFNCNALPGSGETGGTVSVTPCYGTRSSNLAPDPLLGMDIFQGSNLSLKNSNFRASRCGECHAGGTLTDNTVPFTVKAQLGDFIGEFLSFGNEALIEPLGMTRIISGFLLEDELNGNGQDAIERRIINQSIVPCPSDGLAYPDGTRGGLGQGFGLCGAAGAALFDNGVYNLGVTRCDASQSGVVGACDDNGRGNTDAFGWPLSHSAKLLKNLGGPGQEPGTPLASFNASEATGGLFEETAQDQQLNPGEEDGVANPQMPAYLAPFASKVKVGDAAPDLDEVDVGLNTLTDTAMLEGFVDILGPFNPAGLLNESMNNAEGMFMGTWPIVNRVGRFGSMKAPQLREVELTGPYFHNGGKLTLRQVVDFYVRGGDFPITNQEHRDFNIVNQNVEVQSNLSEAEKVALVDFLLELTDERVRLEKGPFDHPQMIIPLNGKAPENTGGRDAMLAGCVAFTDPAQGGGPGRSSCAGSMFLDVPATGNGGNTAGPLPAFLGLSNQRLVGPAANCGAAAHSQYCH